MKFCPLYRNHIFSWFRQDWKGKNTCGLKINGHGPIGDSGVFFAISEGAHVLSVPQSILDASWVGRILLINYSGFRQRSVIGYIWRDFASFLRFVWLDV